MLLTDGVAQDIGKRRVLLAESQGVVRRGVQIPSLPRFRPRRDRCVRGRDFPGPHGRGVEARFGDPGSGHADIGRCRLGGDGVGSRPGLQDRCADHDHGSRAAKCRVRRGRHGHRSQDRFGRATAHCHPPSPGGRGLRIGQRSAGDRPSSQRRNARPAFWLPAHTVPAPDTPPRRRRTFEPQHQPDLGLSVKTVDNRRANMMKKLRVRSAAESIAAIRSVNRYAVVTGPGRFLGQTVTIRHPRRP